MSSSIQRIRFRACITGPETVVEHGELVIEDGIIQSVLDTPTQAAEAEVLDLSDHLLLPGFVNAHSHLALSALSGKLSRKERFTDWVRDLLNADAQISEAERLEAMQAGAWAMLESGVTALGDFAGNAGLLDAMVRLPFRMVVFLETLGFRDDRMDATLERVRSVLEVVPADDGLLRLGLAPHAPYSVSPRLLCELKQLASQYEVPFSCHVAEFPEEVRFLRHGGGELEAFLKERGAYDADWRPPGQSPAAYLDGLGVLDGMTAVHLNEVDGDLGLLSERGVRAVFCPGGTQWFGRTRAMPVRALLDRGVSVGLGTDSLASNASLNFLRELKIAEALLPDVSRWEIIQMATEGGAQALRINAGTIAPGRCADLTGFRIEETPASWADAPFMPERQRADFVMVQGKPVFSSSL